MKIERRNLSLILMIKFPEFCKIDCESLAYSQHFLTMRHS